MPPALLRIGVLVALVSSGPVAAAPEGSTASVTVTATRLPPEGEAAPESLSVVDARERFEAGVRGAPEALRGVPGVDVMRQGSEGEQWDIRLRGANLNQTLVLLEGIPAVSPFDGTFYGGDLPLVSFGRMQVVRGTQSALYGSEALGGVLDLRLRRAERPAGADLWAEGGAYDLSREGLLAEAQADGVDAAAVAGRTDFGGIGPRDRFGSTTFSGEAGGPLGGGEIRAGAWTLDSSKEIRVAAPLSRVDFSGPVARLQLVDDPNFTVKRRVSLWTASYDRRVGEAHRIEARVGLLNEEVHQENGPDPLSTDAFDERISGDRLYGEVTETWRAARRLTLLGGVSAQGDQARLKGDSNVSGWGVGSPTPEDLGDSRRTLAAFAEAALRPAEDLTVHLGGRGEQSSAAPDAGRVDPRLWAGWRIPAWGTHLRGGAGTGYRLPTPAEAWGYPFLATTILKPTTSWSWEGGIDQDLPRGIRLSLTYFEANYRDFVLQDPSTGRYSNVGLSWVGGIEGEASLPAADWLRAGATLTHLTARQLDPLPAPLPWRPVDEGSVRLDAHWGEVLGAELEAFFATRHFEPYDVVRQDGTLLPSGWAPGWSRLDGAVRWQALARRGPLASLDLEARVENVLNARIEEVRGWPAPPRTWSGGIRARF